MRDHDLQARARFEGFVEGRRWGMLIGAVLGMSAALVLAFVAKSVALKEATHAEAVKRASAKPSAATTCYPLLSGSQVCTDTATDFRCMPGPGGASLLWVERGTGERKAGAADCMAWRVPR